MALEKSVLNTDEMMALLQTEYGLHFIDRKKLALGSANCFKVRCEEGDFFLKEYQSDFTMDRVDREADIVSYLRGRRFPVAGFVKTLNGGNAVLYEGHVISVQDYVEGKSYLNDLPHALLMKSAGYLGRMHSLLKDYPLETEMDYRWAESISAEAVARKFDALLAALEAERSDPNYAKIREDLIFKKNLMTCIDDWKQYFRGITFSATHGDYTACQLICGEDDIRAIIDFSSAGTLPVVWEIMRSYIQSGGVGRNETTLDVEDLVAYVAEYMKYAPLTRRDLEAMPYLYLFQLTQSSYGYKEYLIAKTENREALLDFAFWRTGICREIHGKANEISDALSALIDR